MNSKVLAHVGLGLVTYVPLASYLVFVYAMQPDDAAEIFGSGVAAFLGFLATMMMMFGLPLLIAALVISVRGLIKRRHTGLNGATLACCLAWFACAFWVMANFR